MEDLTTIRVRSSKTLTPAGSLETYFKTDGMRKGSSGLGGGAKNMLWLKCKSRLKEAIHG